MIRIVRPAEPATLRQKRATQMAVAIAAINAHGVDSAQLRKCLKGYDARGVREALYSMQGFRCAYCEVQIHSSGYPVERFRPKAYTTRRGETDNSRYWWLAWTWENLFLSCPTCNGTGHKGNRFDLMEDTKPCPIPDIAALLQNPHPKLPTIDEEKPLLVDPTSREPSEHFLWHPKEPSLPPKNWSWTVVGQTEAGIYTINTLRLLRAAELGRPVWRYSLRPALESIGAWSATIKVSNEEWLACCAEQLQPDQSYLGARFGMLRWAKQSLVALAHVVEPSPPCLHG